MALGSFLTTHFFSISLPPAYDPHTTCQDICCIQLTCMWYFFLSFQHFLSCTFPWYLQISMAMLENVRVISERYHWQNTERLVLTFRWECCMTLEKLHFVWSFVLHDHWIYATGYKLWQISAVNGKTSLEYPELFLVQNRNMYLADVPVVWELNSTL